MRVVGPDVDAFGDDHPPWWREPHADNRWKNRRGQYSLPHPRDPKKKLTATGATTFAKAISNTFGLNQWHKRKVAEGFGKAPHLAAVSAGIGQDPSTDELEKQDRFQALAVSAENFANVKGPAEEGVAIHSLSLAADRQDSIIVPEEYELDIAAYRAVVEMGGLSPLAELSEQIIWNEQYNVCGMFDRLWRWPAVADCLVVGDLKTGRDLQYGWNEIAVQLGLYAGGSMIFDQRTERWQEMPEVCRDRGLVLHLPIREGRAILFELDLSTEIDVGQVGLRNMGTSAMSAQLSPIDLCLAIREWRKDRKLAVPVLKVEAKRVGSSIVVERVELSIEERIELAASHGELVSIWEEHAWRWSSSLTRRARARQKLLDS